MKVQVAQGKPVLESGSPGVLKFWDSSDVIFVLLWCFAIDILQCNDDEQ